MAQMDGEWVARQLERGSDPAELRERWDAGELLMDAADTVKSATQGLADSITEAIDSGSSRDGVAAGRAQLDQARAAFDDAVRRAELAAGCSHGR